jgi:hypothetical protein
VNAPRKKHRLRSKAQWDKLRADYLAAMRAADDQESSMRIRWGDRDWRTWSSKSEQKKFEKLRAHASKIGNKMTDMLVEVSPRGDAWLTGAPVAFIYRDLSWEDATRPVHEPLSVTVPAPYGADRGLT